MGSGLSRVKRAFFWWPVASLAAVWCLLYLPNLRTSPGWYGDETLSLSIGLSLTHGIPANRPIWDSFWHPAAPYQPFYEFLVGGSSRLAGGDIVGGRCLSAALALAISLLFYFYGRRLAGFFPAWFAALAFLSYEQTVIHFRSIFPHDLVALGFTVAFLALARKPRPRNDLVAGCGLAAAAGGIPLFAYGAVGAGLLRLRHPRSWLRLAGPPLLMVCLSLALGACWPPRGFLAGDLAAMVHFYLGSTADSSGSLGGCVLNVATFFCQDGWHLAGFAALTIASFGRHRAIGIGGWIVALLLLQNRQNLPVFYYEAIVLLPLMMFSYGIGLRRASSWLRRGRLRRGSLRLLQMGLLLVPLLSVARLVPQAFAGTLAPRNQYWVTQSPEEVQAAASWLNERTGPDDFVAANSNIAWLLHARTYDYIQAAAWKGWLTWPYDIPLPPAQFRYPADVSRAKYAVIGDIDMRYTLAQPKMNALVGQFQAEKWPVVWRGKWYCILENPRPPGRP